MYRLDNITKMQDMYFNKGMSYAAIARELDCDYRTVEKYVNMEDFSPQVPELDKPSQSKLDPYKPWIDKTLADDLERRPDQKGRRKQVHTAQRVYDRLVELYPEFDCSYRTVATYVRTKKGELRLGRKEGFLPLIHPPGTAQVDFGTADFIENGILHQGAKYLVVSFPHSNAGYLQLCYGENLECLLDGLISVFSYIGGVPYEIWFDNASSMVSQVLKAGDRKLTERFDRFCLHYGFKPVFMNPASGNEKGNVENKVGYLRRNMLVPVPEFTRLDDKNRQLLRDCDENMQREHYRKNTDIASLFEEDKAHLLSLPTTDFDPSRYEVVKTDKYGKFTIDRNYSYSASPDYALTQVIVRLTSTTVTVMAHDHSVIVAHNRLYGPEGVHMEAMSLIPYLRAISRKPRSLHNSGLYDMLPQPVQGFLDECDRTDLSHVLKSLAAVAERSGFDTAVAVVQEAIAHQAHDADSIDTLYRRITSNEPWLPSLPPEQLSSAPRLETIVPRRDDIASLDSVLRQLGGGSNG